MAFLSPVDRGDRIVEAFLEIIERVDKTFVVVVPPSVDEESRLAVERGLP